MIWHWFPLFYGVNLNKKWSKIHFYVMFIGVNITFFPQHFLGLRGIPRRYCDYPDCYSQWHWVSSYGALVSFVSLLYFLFVVWEAKISQRGVVFSSHRLRELDWSRSNNLFPLASHRFNVLPWIYVNKKNRNILYKYMKTENEK